ncbi:MAG TPA: hypothetical protein VNL77_19205, partial [Roseiflexaceae bacterium]|nr:hypothetical protein [Roseiflexaceae bacterium]
LVDTATTAHDKMVIEAFSHLVVRLPAGGYGTTEFDMSDARREALVEAGRDAMRAYFERPAPPPVLGAEDMQAPAEAMRVADRIALRLLAP